MPSSSRSGGRRRVPVPEHTDSFACKLLTTLFNPLIRHNAHCLTREEHSVRILRLPDPEDEGCTLVRNDGKYFEVEIGLGGRILVALFSVGVFMKIHSRGSRAVLWAHPLPDFQDTNAVIL